VLVLVVVLVLGKLSSPTYSLWMVGITAKRTAIPRTRRRQEGEDFGVSSVEPLARSHR
jgi:hypothetical protein